MYVQTSNRRPYLYLFTCAFYNAPSTTSSLFPILKHCTIQENYSRKQLHFQLTLNSMTLVFWEFIKSSRKQTALHLSKDSDGQHSTRGCVHMETDTNCEQTKKYEHLRFFKLLLNFHKSKEFVKGMFLSLLNILLDISLFILIQFRLF